MLRASLLKVLAKPTRACTTYLEVRNNATIANPVKAPEKIEVFVDDQPVLVDPGTTVLQVFFNCILVALVFKENFLLGCCTGWSRNSTILLS